MQIEFHRPNYNMATNLDDMMLPALYWDEVIVGGNRLTVKLGDKYLGPSGGISSLTITGTPCWQVSDNMKPGSTTYKSPPYPKWDQSTNYYIGQGQ